MDVSSHALREPLLRLLLDKTRLLLDIARLKVVLYAGTHELEGFQRQMDAHVPTWKGSCVPIAALAADLKLHIETHAEKYGSSWG
jgi:hypothetical protein